MNEEVTIPGRPALSGGNVVTTDRSALSRSWLLVSSLGALFWLLGQTAPVWAAPDTTTASANLPQSKLLPGPDGSLSIWAVLGPLDDSAGLDPARVVLGQDLASGNRASKWRLLAQARRTWRLVGPRSRSKRGRVLVCGLLLQPGTDKLVRLSVASNAQIEVWLDKRRIAVRNGERFAPDGLLVDLPLHQGKNQVLLLLRRSAPHRLWKARVRFLNRDFAPLTEEAKILLPLADGRTSPMVTVSLQTRMDGTKLSRHLRIQAPGGLVEPARNLVFHARWPGSAKPLHRILSPTALTSRSIQVAVPAGLSGTVTVTSPIRKRIRIPNTSTVVALVRQAEAALTRAPSTLPPDSLQSLRFHLDRLERLIEANDRDSRYLLRLARLLLRWCRKAAQGRDPFDRVHGRVVMAVRSAMDGSIQPYSIWIPRGAKQRKLPLYVMLHGLECSHRKGLNQMLGVWMPKDDPTPWRRFIRHLPPPKVSPRALVLAPQAFGDSFYRHEGEVAVFEAIEAVKRRFRVDPDRIILVGHSMGGTGVLELGLKHPDVFAGMVSLSGYPSRWIFPSIRRGPLRPWERAAARTWSPVLWVQNRHRMPLIAVHGTRDHADRAQALVRAYLRTGGRALLHLFEEGHSIWRQYLADGRIYRETKSWRKAPIGRALRFRTTRPRWPGMGPLSIETMGSMDQWAQIVMTHAAGRRRIQTKNVTDLAIRTDGAGLRPGSVLLLDEQPVTLPPTSQGPVRFEKTNGRWSRARVHTGISKTPGLAGPIGDIYYGPVVVVTGTKNPQTKALMALLASHFSRHGRSSVRYPVIQDSKLSGETAGKANLILLGGPDLNSVTARLAGRLPIGLDQRGIHLAGRTITAKSAATLFVAPNPEHPDRYVLVLAGNSPAAMVHSLALPAYLPDWVLFDDQVQKSALPRILGPDRQFVAAGWFDRNWKLSPPAGRDTPQAR